MEKYLWGFVLYHRTKWQLPHHLRHVCDYVTGNQYGFAGNVCIWSQLQNDFQRHFFSANVLDLRWFRILGFMSGIFLFHGNFTCLYLLSSWVACVPFRLCYEMVKLVVRTNTDWKLRMYGANGEKFFRGTYVQ